jgi:ribosomal protein L37E
MGSSESSGDESDPWTNRVGMGSTTKFERHICGRCGDSSFLNAGGFCGDCEYDNAVATTPCITFKYLLERVKLPEAIIDTFVPYLLKIPENSWVTFRKAYLRKMLLAWSDNPWTQFRMLTYQTNGMAASISDTEDCIDRVLSFVVELPAHQVQPPKSPGILFRSCFTVM